MGDEQAGGAPIRQKLELAHSITSAGQIEALNASGLIAVEFTTPGRVTPHFAIGGLQSSQFCIWATRSGSGFTTYPRYEAELLTMRFVDHGSMIRRDSRDEHVAFARMAMLVAFESMRNEEASRQFSGQSATIARTALAAGHDALVGREDGILPDFEPVIEADALPIRVVRRTLEQVLDRARAMEPNDLVLSLLEEILAYQILSAWPCRAPVSTRPTALTSSTAIRKAIDYIEENIAQRIALSDVAAAIGTSVRSLQSTFRKELGVTPVTYIIDRRLKAVHDDLCDPATNTVSVGEIARRWGFIHQGDFGQRFRSRYGMSPSEMRRGGRAATTSRPARVRAIRPAVARATGAGAHTDA